MMGTLNLVFPAKSWKNDHASRIMFKEIMEVILNWLSILRRSGGSSIGFANTNNKCFSFYQFCRSVAMFVKKRMIGADNRRLALYQKAKKVCKDVKEFSEKELKEF